MNKSSLLISVKNIEEIKKIYEYANIVDLKNPSDGALGAWKIQQVSKAIKIYKNKICFSATLGNIKNNDIILKKLLKFDNLGLDYIKIGMFHNSISQFEEFLNLLKYTKIKTKLVAVFFAENKKLISYVKRNMSIFLNSKLSILLIDTFNKRSKGLLEIYKLEFLNSFILLAKKKNIRIGLSGRIRKDQIFELLELNPSIIGIRSAVCDKFKREQMISAKLAGEIRALF